MRDIDLLRLEADAAFVDLLASLEGISEEQAWGQAKLLPDEYMHSEGSIYSVVLHIAAGKFIYGSVGYRNMEVRWRDCVARFESFWPDWKAAKEYLNEGQAYWLQSWGAETDLERMVPIHQGRQMPSWQAIWTVIHHDAYHAGQIQYLRATVPPSKVPPPEEGDLWRQYCGPSPSW
ncbi:DinB family protein [Fimbriimonas ginsengisoli]|nr:DinB family protein [Fimbriimonas ginsengisoli]